MVTRSNSLSQMDVSDMVMLFVLWVVFENTWHQSAMLQVPPSITGHENSRIVHAGPIASGDDGHASWPWYGVMKEMNGMMSPDQSQSDSSTQRSCSDLTWPKTSDGKRLTIDFDHLDTASQKVRSEGKSSCLLLEEPSPKRASPSPLVFPFEPCVSCLYLQAVSQRHQWVTQKTAFPERRKPVRDLKRGSYSACVFENFDYKAFDRLCRGIVHSGSSQKAGLGHLRKHTVIRISLSPCLNNTGLSAKRITPPICQHCG
jgi:hypothetical protein